MQKCDLIDLRSRMRGSWLLLLISGSNHQLVVTVSLDCYLYFKHRALFGYSQESLPGLIRTVDKWKSLVSSHCSSVHG